MALAAYDPTPPADHPALEFLDRIADDLSRSPLNLPRFPDIVPRVRAALADPRSTQDDLVRIAGTEPGLAARLIQTANSAVFNPSGKPLTNLRQSVTRLGHHLGSTRNIAWARYARRWGAEARNRIALRPWKSWSQSPKTT